MKKLLLPVGVIVLLAVGAVAVLPALIPADKIKQQVVTQVKTATGRDLKIDGKVSVSVFPSVAVEVNNIALANPAGFSSPDLVRLGALDIQLKLLPLLSGRVEVASFVLLDPVVVLEVDRHGKPNWVFDTTPTAPADKAAPAPATPAAPVSPSSAPPSTASPPGTSSTLGDVVLGDVRIANGKLSYIDASSGRREDVDGVNLAVSLLGLDSPMTAKGALNWHGKAVELGLSLTAPRALLQGARSSADILINAEAIKLTFQGDAAIGAQPGTKGTLNLSVPSVRNLAQWATGKPLAIDGSGLGPFSLATSLDATPTTVALHDAAITLDAITAKGNVSIDTGDTRPAIRGQLQVDTLDLNPYLPPDSKMSAAGGNVPAAAPASPGGGTAVKADWSDDVIDAQALKAVDVDFALAVGAIKMRKLQVGKSALRLVLKDGRLSADLSQLSLYQGSGNGKLALDGSQPGIGLDATFFLKGLAAQPFLSDAADFDRIEGTGNFNIQVGGRGRSQRQLISSLNGKGAVTFLNGAIRGINLAAMVRNVTSAFTDSGDTQKTDFAELGGTFTITKGVVNNQDLALKSPLLRVEGKGTVELPTRTLHYRIEPKAVASLEGQGGKSDLSGIQVPVIIEGPWDNLSYRPDLEAMLKSQAGKAIQNAIGGKAGGLLGGGSSDGGQSSPLPINPGNLFGR